MYLLDLLLVLVRMATLLIQLQQQLLHLLVQLARGLLLRQPLARLRLQLLLQVGHLQLQRRYHTLQHTLSYF